MADDTNAPGESNNSQDRTEDEELSEEELLALLNETEANWNWINQRRAELIEEFPNEYVCVKDQDVIAHGRDLKEILKGITPSNDMVCEYIVPHGYAMIL